MAKQRSWLAKQATATASAIRVYLGAIRSEGEYEAECVQPHSAS